MVVTVIQQCKCKGHDIIHLKVVKMVNFMYLLPQCKRKKKFQMFFNKGLALSILVLWGKR